MSAKSLNPELVTALKRLRLGGMLPTLLDRLTLADQQSVAFQDVLLMLLSDEISRRDSGAAERRAQQAGLDPDMVLERWDKSAKVSYDKRLLAELCSLRFVAEHRNLVVLGPVGVGKTYWSTALSHLCCRAGYNVRFSRADALLRSLRQSRMDNSREALMTALCTVDVLVLDDFALEPMGREESRDIYQLFVERKGNPFPLEKLARLVAHHYGINSLESPLLRHLDLTLNIAHGGITLDNNPENPQRDHIFPRATLEKAGTPPEKTNHYANFHFLRGKDNLNKSDTAPHEWFKKPGEQPAYSDNDLKERLLSWELLQPGQFPALLEQRMKAIHDRALTLFAMKADSFDALFTTP